MLFVMHEKEEDFWQQRFRENRLLHGDCNTEYFHRMANGAIRKKTIFSLKHGSQVIQGT
jgi:hypothetical protein